MRKNSSEIASVIRERICLTAGTDEMLLHEGELASEFGVSRTPIRQVLQMLAYESLVETRSGVGTIVTPLHAQARASDERAFRAILTAAGACPSGSATIPDITRLKLSEARRNVNAEPTSAEALFGGLSGLLEATVPLVGDHIVATALRSVYWRHIRWSLSQDEGQRLEALQKMKTLLDRAIVTADEIGADGLLELLTRDAI